MQIISISILAHLSHTSPKLKINTLLAVRINGELRRRKSGHGEPSGRQKLRCHGEAGRSQRLRRSRREVEIRPEQDGCGFVLFVNHRDAHNCIQPD